MFPRCHSPPRNLLLLCIFAVEDSRRNGSQEDEAISAMCLQHIYQSWVPCMHLHAVYILVTIGLWNGVRIVGEDRLTVTETVTLPQSNISLIVVGKLL